MNLLAEQLRISAMQVEATRFQRFARDAPIGIVFISSDGRVQFANDEYLRIIDRSREEFEVERFRPGPGGVPRWLRPELGARHESEYVRSDGTRVPILVGLSSQPDGLAAFVIDLTSEKSAQLARQKSEERYRAIAEKLEEADRRKNEFLSVLSHELRNPLAPIRNALHLLARAPDDLARTARARDVIARQFGHLSRLVDDLLDITRITRGRIELHREPLDLSRLVRDTVEDHRGELEAAGLRLLLEVPTAVVPIDGDATRLAQVLGNLLANSAKFTARGGMVTVRVGKEPGGTALLEVRDSGEGIDADVLPRIFEPFSQADRTLARSRGGLGLGLTVVKGLVELHGGTVAVRVGEEPGGAALLEVGDTGEGIEADVLSRLFQPFSQADRSLARSRGGLGLGLTVVKGLVELHGGTVAVTSGGRGAGTKVVVRLPLAPALPPPGPRADTAPSIAHVLIVEDNVDAAETLREALKLEGMAVTVAYDGDAGLDAARRNVPDLVICDIGLPGDLDGYGVARAIRADPALRHTPLVALTGYAGPEDQARALEAGFDRHLAKPIGIEDLLHAIAPLTRH